MVKPISRPAQRVLDKGLDKVTLRDLRTITKRNSTARRVSMRACLTIMNAACQNATGRQIHKKEMFIDKQTKQRAFLSSILQDINVAKAADGGLDLRGNVNPDGSLVKDSILDKLTKAHDKIGLEVNVGKHQYTRDELKDLVSNIKMSQEEIGTIKSTENQKLLHLGRILMQSSEIATNLGKSYHDAGQNIARNYNR